MKYYIIAGEASGDLHASNLMKELKALDQDARFRFWGGDRMLAQGGEIVKHIREMSFMGFWEVMLNLRTILKSLEMCRKDILLWKPDALILVDYPGFNLRMATFAKAHGIRVIYYISPQIWAWKQSRIKRIKQVVDKMLVILPFEQAFYRRFGMEVDFTGHPLVDALEEFKSTSLLPDFLQKNGLNEVPIVALLPGSRKVELASNLRTMASLAKHFPEFQFVVAAVRSYPESYYQKIIKGSSVKIVTGQTYHLLSHSRAALVASGTATLEAALLGVPQIVCYRAGKISYFIVKQLVKVKFISLVNLIADRQLVQEMIQHRFNSANLKNELSRLLQDIDYVKEIREGYQQMYMKLGGSGASRKAANIVHSYLTGN
ncbi:MAG TPA: lipid-A-disaccharide synthase [Bacteroidales bacterium]|nr:lipid-A-disaccharide synthase [Bacteroidales bacterium]